MVGTRGERDQHPSIRSPRTFIKFIADFRLPEFQAKPNVYLGTYASVVGLALSTSGLRENLRAALHMQELLKH